MQLFKELIFPNLNIIQSKVLEIINDAPLPPTIPTSYQLDFKHKDIEVFEDRFKKISELTDTITGLGLLPYWSFTSIIISKQDGVPAHIDAGIGTYTLLIPIQNTKNTFTVFYKSLYEPELKAMGEYDKYMSVKDPYEIERIELSRPILFRTTSPHGVVNNSDVFPRITISIRLTPEFDDIKFNQFEF